LRIRNRIELQNAAPAGACGSGARVSVPVWAAAAAALLLAVSISTGVWFSRPRSTIRPRCARSPARCAIATA
jgi:hypothetical protein